MGINREPSYPPAGSPSFSPSTRPVYRGGAAPGGGGASWTPDLLPSWASGGDWWKNGDTTKMFTTNGGSTNSSALNDPVADWVGQMNGLVLQNSTAGNQPKYDGAGGVRCQFDGAHRRLFVSSPLINNSVAHTIWFKTDISANANPSLIMGLIDGAWSVKGGVQHAGVRRYAVVRASVFTEVGVATGSNTYIVTYDGASTAYVYENDLAPVAVLVGSESTNRYIAISSGAGDHVVKDFGVYLAAMSESEITNLKTYLGTI